MRKPTTLLLATPLILLFSCGESKNTYFDQILKSTQGHVRGVEIGASLDEVREVESGQPEVEEGYLHYEVVLDEAIEDEFTVEYSFDEKGLYEIYIEVMVDKPEVAANLLNKFNTHYTNKFGSSEESGPTHAVWTISSDNSDEIEIYLEDESSGYDYGVLTITITDYDYDY